MFSIFSAQERQILIGNILFVVCCGFYLAWWLLAFKPTGAVSGMKTGWLLIPAGVAGLLGVIQVIAGILAGSPAKQIFPGGHIIWGGIAAYFILLAVTVLVFKRPATSELILIIGWGMLALAEINALFGYGLLSHKMSVGFLSLICAVVVISLVCYILYYRLSSAAGYIDGMIPLLLSALTMATVSCFMVVQGR